MTWLRPALRALGEALAVQASGLLGTLLAACALLLGVGALTGERFAVVALLNHVVPWVLLANIALWALALLTPQRVLWTVYAVPGLLAFALWYAPQLTPRPTPPSDGPALQVMTYNISGVGVSQQATIDFIRAHPVDVLAVQEYGLRRLPNAVADLYPHANADWDHGLALFSRHPIVAGSVRWLTLNVEGSTQRFTTAQVATVDWDGEEVVVVNAHLRRPEASLWPPAYNGALRQEGVRAVLNVVRAEARPLVLLCDCNTSDRTADYARLADALSDAWAVQGGGLGMTAPANARGIPFPLMRADMIWHNAALRPVLVQVLPASTSDHLPVRAQLVPVAVTP